VGEIGYDVPEIRVAMILATSYNMHQIAQRIGRTLRKTAGKDTALIYTIYLSHTQAILVEGLNFLYQNM